MALINCYECNKEISDQAKSCPHCGAVPIKPRADTSAGVAVLVVFTISMILIFSFANMNSKSSSNKSSTPSNSQVIVFAKESVRKQLREPESAEFRDIKLNSNGIPCGYVNAKNGFGGYTGFKRFVGMGDIVAIEGGNISDTEFEKSWRIICNQ